jgi:hypothetical protein
MAPLHQGKRKDLQEALCFKKERKGVSAWFYLDFNETNVKYKNLKSRN